MMTLAQKSNNNTQNGPLFHEISTYNSVDLNGEEGFVMFENSKIIIMTVDRWKDKTFQDAFKE